MVLHSGQSLQSRDAVVVVGYGITTNGSRHGITDILSRRVRAEKFIKKGVPECFREEEVHPRDEIASKIIIDFVNDGGTERDVRAGIIGIQGILRVRNRQQDALSILVALEADVGRLTVDRPCREVRREHSVAQTDVFLNALGTKIVRVVPVQV